MADPEIPPELLQVQLDFELATDAVRAASRRPGPVSEWEQGHQDDLAAVRAAELAAMKKLRATRAEAGWGTAEQAKRVKLAALAIVAERKREEAERKAAEEGGQG